LAHPARGKACFLALDCAIQSRHAFPGMTQFLFGLKQDIRRAGELRLCRLDLGL
jgi:hypothetical protein